MRSRLLILAIAFSQIVALCQASNSKALFKVAFDSNSAVAHTASPPFSRLTASSNRPTCDSVFYDSRQRQTRIYCNADSNGLILKMTTSPNFVSCITSCEKFNGCTVAVFDNSTNVAAENHGICTLQALGTKSDRKLPATASITWRYGSFVACKVDAANPQLPADPMSPAPGTKQSSAVNLDHLASSTSLSSTSSFQKSISAIFQAAEASSSLDTPVTTPVASFSFPVPEQQSRARSLTDSTKHSSSATSVRLTVRFRSTSSTTTLPTQPTMRSGRVTRSITSDGPTSPSRAITTRTRSTPTTIVSSSSTDPQARSSTPTLSTTTTMLPVSSSSTEFSSSHSSVSSSSLSSASSSLTGSSITSSLQSSTTKKTSSTISRPTSTAISPHLSNPTLLGTGEDESQYGVELPFTMALFTQSSQDVTITTNGILSLGNPSKVEASYTDNSGGPATFPTYMLIPGTAAVWWQYLQSFKPGLGVYYQIDDNHLLSVEWLMADQDDVITNAIMTYDAYNPGSVTYYYFTSGDTGSNSTIGVQGLDTTDDLAAVMYEPKEKNTVRAGLMLTFTTSPDQAATYASSTFSVSCFPQDSFPEGICGTAAT